MIKQRRVSLIAHLIYLVLTVTCGAAASWTLWDQWFDSGWLATLVIGVVEILSISSLILYIAKVPWPLAAFRHMLPVLSVAPLSYALYTQLEGRNPAYVSIPVAVGLGIWFTVLTHILMHSFENLFVDPAILARERMDQERERLATGLAIYRGMIRSAQEFEASIIQHRPNVEVLSTSSPQLPVDNESQVLQLTDSADPRLGELIELAALRGNEGWEYTQAQIQERTKYNIALVNTVCKLVRSGHLAVGGRHET